jgi:hypothetical protein
MTVERADGRREVSLPVTRHLDHEEADLAVALGARRAVITDHADNLLYEVKRTDGAQAAWRTATMSGVASIPLLDLTLWHGARYSLAEFAARFGGRLEFREEPA